jgi:hypothetical protein
MRTTDVIELTLKRAANKATKVIGTWRGERFPFYYVTEYPRSGGSWLGCMLADALQVPFPRNPILPVGFSCVVHNHWRYNPRLRRVFYLFRDGRDVMVSLFFHRMRRIAQGRSPAARRRSERLFGRGYDANDCIGLLPRFIEEEFRHPRDARLNWREHVLSWYDERRRPRVVYLSYERLLADPAAELQATVNEATGRTLDPWLVATAVEKFSMHRMTGGRRSGDEDRSSFIRKAAPGDWVNHFSAEASELFADLAGDALIALGYAADRSWAERPATRSARAMIEPRAEARRSAAAVAAVPR